MIRRIALIIAVFSLALGGVANALPAGLTHFDWDTSNCAYPLATSGRVYASSTRHVADFWDSGGPVAYTIKDKSSGGWWVSRHYPDLYNIKQVHFYYQNPGSGSTSSTWASCYH